MLTTSIRKARNEFVCNGSNLWYKDRLYATYAMESLTRKVCKGLDTFLRGIHVRLHKACAPRARRGNGDLHNDVAEAVHNPRGVGLE